MLCTQTDRQTASAVLSGLGSAALPGLPLTALPGKGTLQSGSAAERGQPRALPVPVTKDCFLLLPRSAQCIFVSLSDALFVAHIIHEGKYFSGPFFSAVLLLGGLDYSTRTHPAVAWQEGGKWRRCECIVPKEEDVRGVGGRLILHPCVGSLLPHASAICSSYFWNHPRGKKLIFKLVEPHENKAANRSGGALHARPTLADRTGSHPL